MSGLLLAPVGCPEKLMLWLEIERGNTDFTDKTDRVLAPEKLTNMP
jgi:hypothetical protein